MSFLKKFLKTAYRDGHTSGGPSSFENLTEHQLEAHLSISRYGEFQLTDAVRPSYGLEVIPQAGYRHDTYQDSETGVEIPVLMAAASKENLFELFIDMLAPLGETVDVVLETSHERPGGGHLDLYREHIDRPILTSILYDFEDLLTNDGCSGIAVLNPQIPLEVQFDEHKLLMMYGKDLSEFEYVLNDHSMPCEIDLKFITEAEHVHSSGDEYLDQFEQLRYRLGIED